MFSSCWTCKNSALSFDKLWMTSSNSVTLSLSKSFYFLCFCIAELNKIQLYPLTSSGWQAQFLSLWDHKKYFLIYTSVTLSLSKSFYFLCFCIAELNKIQFNPSTSSGWQAQSLSLWACRRVYLSYIFITLNL